MQLSDVGRIAEEYWRLIASHAPNVELATYAIMPNHIHGILILRADSRGGTIFRAPTTHDRAPTTQQFQKPVVGSIPTIVRTYKAAVTRKIARQSGDVSKIWQRNDYEHVIRDAEELNRIHLYIEANVANWMADAENPECTEPAVGRPIPWETP